MKRAQPDHIRAFDIKCIEMLLHLNIDNNCLLKTLILIWKSNEFDEIVGLEAVWVAKNKY